MCPRHPPALRHPRAGTPGTHGPGIRAVRGPAAPGRRLCAASGLGTGGRGRGSGSGAAALRTRPPAPAIDFLKQLQLWHFLTSKHTHTGTHTQRLAPAHGMGTQHPHRHPAPVPGMGTQHRHLLHAPSTSNVHPILAPAPAPIMGTQHWLLLHATSTSNMHTSTSTLHPVLAPSTSTLHPVVAPSISTQYPTPAPCTSTASPLCPCEFCTHPWSMGGCCGAAPGPIPSQEPLLRSGFP